MSFLLSSVLFEKLELVQWDEYCKLVADAYDQAPDRESRAIPAYTAMRDFVLKLFGQINSKAKVEFVDGDPYQSAEEMRADVKANKRLRIMKDHSDHPFFSPEENWKFRAVHDWYTHVIGGEPFNRKGELKTYNRHIKMFPPAAHPALFTEIVGQVCYQTTRGSFPTQKVAILDGFDYVHIGKVDGYVIKNKTLTQQTA